MNTTLRQNWYGSGSMCLARHRVTPRGLLSFCHCESNFKSLTLQPEWLEHGNEGERRGGVSDKQRHGGMHYHACSPMQRVCGWGLRTEISWWRWYLVLKQTKHFETLISNPNYASVLFKSISKQILTVIFYMALWKLWVWVQPVDETNATLFPASLKTLKSHYRGRFRLVSTQVTYNFIWK